MRDFVYRCLAYLVWFCVFAALGVLLALGI